VEDEIGLGSSDCVCILLYVLRYQKP